MDKKLTPLLLDHFGALHGFLKKDAVIIEFAPSKDNEIQKSLVVV